MPGPIPPLYGDCAIRINHRVSRRLLLGAALALPVAAQAGPARTDLLTRAMNAIGGAELLVRVKAVGWEAHAEVTMGDKKIAITSKTRCEPFGAYRADSNLVGGTPDTARAMISGPEGDMLEFAGKSEPMPAAMAAHEREQFGIYGYLLLGHAPWTEQEGRLLIAEHEGYPRCVLHVGPEGVITAAEYAVIRHDGQGTVGQWFEFEGRISDQGVSWPRKTTIYQDGNPWFTLTLDKFAVELA